MKRLLVAMATRPGAQERKIDIYRLPLKKPKIENGAALFKDELCKKRKFPPACQFQSPWYT
jgi:hypothetical protein